MARIVRRLCTLLMLFTFAAVDQAGARQASPAPGDRVRITLTGSAAERFGVKGWDAPLHAAGADSIAIERSGPAGPLVVARGDVAKFERFDGHKSKAGKGAAIGLVAGALVGGITTFAVAESGGSCDTGLLSLDFFCEDSADTMGLAGAAAGGLLGLLIGAAVGAANSGDSWTNVNGAVQVTPTVIRGMPGVAMRVAF